MLEERIEVFRHAAISSSAIRVCPENRCDFQGSRVGRILTFRGRVSDLSTIEVLDGVTVVSAANLVVISEIGRQEMTVDHIFPVLLG